MISDRERIVYLLNAYTGNTATEAEEQELFRWVATTGDDTPVREQVALLVQQANTAKDGEGVNWNRLYNQVWQQAQALDMPPAGIVKKMSWRHVLAAAAVAGLIGLSFYFIVRNQHTPVVSRGQSPVAAQKARAIVPGGNRAMLTLADGSTILLDNARNGALAQQGGTQVQKAEAGQLVYNALQNPPAGGALVYNTITTPKGGQYKVILPDGTVAWLNAASSLRFPIAFTGATREVTLTGEAYFEVSKKKAATGSDQPAGMPFIVHTGIMEVEVLGTHFNIMAYDDEQEIKTTLLEGAVKIKQGSNQAMLKPGQQARVSKNGALKVLPKVDVEEAIAWKNGLIFLEGVNIRAIMRQIARWYDVEIQYKGKLDDIDFSGTVLRAKDVTEVLRVLEASGSVHFTITDKTITVTP